MRSRRRALALSTLLLAPLAACYKKSDYSPTASLAGQVITLTSVPSGVTSLPADGFSRVHLQAHLLGDPAFANRTVVFSTTNGTLDGGAAVTNCATCSSVPADGNGNAAIDLVSSQRVGSAVVTATPMGAPGILATQAFTFTAVAPDNIIQFVAAPTQAPADGASLSTFTVAISPSLPSGSRTVTFQATAGGFNPGNVSMVQVSTDAGGHAAADLVSPKTITTARVTATVDGVTREAPIGFVRALPMSITATTDTPVAPAAATTKIHITVTTLRAPGTVTDGTVVTFAATASGSPVGIFTNITTTTNGVATADFLPQTTKPGTVTITIGAQDTAVTGTLQVVLTGGT
jgi:hypothetical protein